jgi:hypothetical protein
MSRSSPARGCRQAARLSALRTAAASLCCVLGWSATAAAQNCLAAMVPVASGPPTADRPPALPFSFNDFTFAHSSANLQGKAATELHAAGLFWPPTVVAGADPAFADFASLVAVTNPSTTPGANAAVSVQFVSTAGTPAGAPLTFLLAPEESIQVPAMPLGLVGGLGSVQVISDLPIVGETWHRADQVDLTAFPGGAIVTQPPGFPDNFGMNCVQQLQPVESTKKTLYSGPFPFSRTASLDFLSGCAPLFWVANVGSVPTTVTLRVYRKNVPTPVITTVVSVASQGCFLYRELWTRFLLKYLSGTPFTEDDYQVVATADEPIIGEMLMVDLFGGTVSTLDLGARMRMGSSLMVGSSDFKLYATELCLNPSTTPGVETILGLSNPTATDAGQLTIRYFDRDGNQLGVDVLANLPAFGTLRVGPGLLPNFPAGSVFSGYVDVQACHPRVVGWSMHTSGDADPKGPTSGLYEVWGEELVTTGAAGPGGGIAIPGTYDTRLVAPLVRVEFNGNDPTFGSWPGHTSATTLTTADAGAYRFRFYGVDGFPSIVQGTETYMALTYGMVSFTYEDSMLPSSSFRGRGALFVDSANGGLFGSHVIGDPAVEWDIPGWPNL